MKSLKFSQALLSQKNKNISTPETVNRLQTLEQDNTDTDSLQKVAKDLVSNMLIDHKDLGVQSLVGVCLVHVLRIFAPDAPYTNIELKKIFDLLLKQLEFIHKVQHPYYINSLQILESLATVKSIVLVTELPHSDKYIYNLFEDFFQHISSDHARNVQIFMLEILKELIEQSNLGSDVIELLLSQFQKKKQRENPAAYQLASELVKMAKERLQYSVFQYFSDAILPFAQNSDDVDELLSLHELVVELNKVCDAVLLSVIPQLEVELKFENIHMRTLATQTLGEIFCAKGSTAAKNYPNCWVSWLAKANDKNTSVRLLWLEYVIRLLKHHPDKAKDLNEALLSKIYDHEEKVRTNTALIFQKLIEEKEISILDGLIEKKMWTEIGQRVKDKRAIVRHEAIKTISKLYNLMYHEMVTADTPLMAEKYGWIPSKLMEVVFISEVDSLTDLERALEEEILPMNLSNESFSKRILLVYSSMDTKARSAFLGLMKKKQVARRNFSKWLQISFEFKGGNCNDPESKWKELQEVGKSLVVEMPDSSKLFQLLMKYSKTGDEKIFKLFEQIVSDDITTSQLLKYRKELAKRLESQSPETLRSFLPLIRKVSFQYVSEQHVPFILQVACGLVQDGSVNELIEQYSRDFIKELSKTFSHLFENHLSSLEIFLSNSDPSIVLDGLFVLSKIYKGQKLELNKELELKLLNFLRNGSSKEARFAAKIIFQTKTIDDFFFLEPLLETNYSDLQLVSRSLCIFTECLKYQPQMALSFSKHENIYRQVILSILEFNLTCSSVQEGDEDVWYEEQVTKECQLELETKLIALNFLGQYLLAHQKIYSEKSKSLSRSILKYLFQIISNEGETNKNLKTFAPYKPWLRLEAALILLKCIKQPTVESLVEQAHFEAFAMSIQDPCYEVREKFVDNVLKRLSSCTIHYRYLTILFLAALEPEQELKLKIKTFLYRLLHRVKNQPNSGFLPEWLLYRLIHLIGHHPDFGNDVESLHLTAKYFDFFFEILANPENVSFLYHIAVKLKTYQDRHGNSENLYTLSDLVQFILQEKCKNHGWTLPSYPGQLELPKALFEKIENEKVVKTILMKNFLPSGFQLKVAKVKTEKHNTEDAMDLDDNLSSAGATSSNIKSSVGVGRQTRASKRALQTEE